MSLAKKFSLTPQSLRRGNRVFFLSSWKEKFRRYPSFRQEISLSTHFLLTKKIATLKVSEEQVRALLTDHLSSQLPSQQVHHYQNLIFWREEENPLNLLGNADFCCDSQFAIKRLFCFSHRKRKRFVVSLVSWLSQADNSQDTRDRGAKFSKRCCCFRRRSGAAGEGNEATRARPELVEARADSQQHDSVHTCE